MRSTNTSIFLATLIASGQAAFRPVPKPFTYEASVEHNFIPWRSTEWHREEVTNSSDYTKQYNEFQQSYNAGAGFGEGVKVDVKVETSFNNIQSVERKIENYKSTAMSSKIKFQDNVRLVQRTVNLKACIVDDCHQKTSETIVSYLDEEKVTDEARKYWKKESFKYLNELLLPDGAKKLEVNDSGYARYSADYVFFTLETVQRKWFGKGYGGVNGYGVRLECPQDMIMTGICGSTGGEDCRFGDGYVNAKIQCSDARTNWNDFCIPWLGTTYNAQKHDSFFLYEYRKDPHYCPDYVPFAQGYCGSGVNPDCNGCKHCHENTMYNQLSAGRCCRKLGLTMDTKNCYRQGSTGGGAELTCRDGYAVHRWCGSGGHLNCQSEDRDYLNVIECCKHS